MRRALYLLFNEGDKASQGGSLVRTELCTEAIRLAELLAASPAGRRPQSHALLALLHLHAARLPARVADDGSLLVLAAQDRAKWDRQQIARGLGHLEKSAAGSDLTRWHLEAGIAASHALAPAFDLTNWPHIVELYDRLLTLNPSPVIADNRAIALAQAQGAAAGLEALAELPGTRALERYHLFHAVQGHLLLVAGKNAEAATALRRALELAVLPAERQLVQQRLDACLSEEATASRTEEFSKFSEPASLGPTRRESNPRE